MTAFPDDAARDYDTRILRMVPGYNLAQELAATMLTAKPVPTKILVAGCGTGSEIIAIAKALPQADITGVDPSPGMIAAARKRMQDAAIAYRVRLETGTVETLDDRPDYDACMVSLVLHFLAGDDNKRAFLTAIRTRLRSGGKLLLIDPALTEDFREPYGAWLAANGLDAMAVAAILNRTAREWHRLLPEQLAALLHDSGFGKPETFFTALAYRGVIATAR